MGIEERYEDFVREARPHCDSSNLVVVDKEFLFELLNTVYGLHTYGTAVKAIVESIQNTYFVGECLRVLCRGEASDYYQAVEVVAKSSKLSDCEKWSRIWRLATD